MPIGTLNGVNWSALSSFKGVAKASIASVNGVVAGSPVPDILWWKFNEGSGTTLTDSSTGGGAAGTHDADYVTGKSGSGYALDFNGSSDDGVTNAALAYGTGKITICFWLKSEGPNSSVVFESSADTNITQHAFYIYYNNTANTLSWVHRSTSATFYSVNVPTPSSGAWFHVLIVGDMLYNQGDGKYGRAQFWVDGSSQTVTVAANNITLVGAGWSAQPFFIGARNRTSFRYNGLIDDVRIYSGDKSADVASIMADAQ